MAATGTAILIENIGELTTNSVHDSGVCHDSAVVIENGTIAWVGPSGKQPSVDKRIDAGGRAILPGWVDSHTHMVFAGDRTQEFTARMSGLPYAAGGIQVTVEATRAASDAELAANLRRLVHEAYTGGTTTLETKTGYGLTLADELRSAKVAAEYVDAVTLLGAHLLPAGQTTESYLRLINGPMLEHAAPYVSSVDVFCEEGAFGELETRAVLAAATEKGFATRVHGNQLAYGPGVRLAVEFGSRSVDHVAFLAPEDIELLAESWRNGKRGTVATVLPACDLSTRMPLAPAKQMLESGIEIAIASNCNPGTSFTSSMNFCVATAVLQMGLSVHEAVRAATYGGALSLGMHLDGWHDPRGVAQPRVGVIEPGAKADLHLLEAPSATHLAYRPGMPLTAGVWRSGERVVPKMRADN